MAKVDNRKWADRKPKAKSKAMTDAFETYEVLLFQKLKEADHIVGLIFKEASLFGVSTDISEPFLQQQFKDMMAQIAEQRDVRTVVG